MSSDSKAQTREIMSFWQVGEWDPLSEADRFVFSFSLLEGARCLRAEPLQRTVVRVNLLGVPGWGRQRERVAMGMGTVTILVCVDFFIVIS